MKYQLETILFDLDGVLVDTPAIVKKTIIGISNRLGLATPSERLLNQIIKKPFRQVLTELFPTHLNEAEASYFYFWSKYLQDVKPFEGIPELLGGLQKLGLTMGTVTSRNGKETLALLNASLILHYMYDVVTWGHYRTAKPSPICILTALKRIGKEAHGAAYLGDQPIDMMAAKRAGVLAIGTLWGAEDEVALTQAGADFIINTPRELLGILIY